MPVLCRRKRSRRQILPSVMPSCIRGKRQRVRTGKGFLTHKGESHCFGWMWNKDQWVLVLRPWRLCRPCPRGRTRSEVALGSLLVCRSSHLDVSRLGSGVRASLLGYLEVWTERGAATAAQINSFVREGGGSQWQWPQQWPQEGVGDAALSLSS